METVLRFVSSVTIYPAIGTFVACEKFSRDTSPEAEVVINSVSDQFHAWFFGGAETSKRRTDADSLRFYDLTGACRDDRIIREIGEVSCETILVEVFALMQAQRYTEPGTLLHNGLPNIFYVQDRSTIRRDVVVSRGRAGWNILAFQHNGQGGWSGGSRVFTKEWTAFSLRWFALS